jgi:hypothetical protein
MIHAPNHVSNYVNGYQDLLSGISFMQKVQMLRKVSYSLLRMMVFSKFWNRRI